MDDSPEILPGDVWRVEGATYRVVGPCKDGMWPLQGPLPTRSMAQGTTEDLHAGVLISRDKR